MRTSGEPFWFHCGVHHIQHFEKKWYMGGFLSPADCGEGSGDQKQIARFLCCVALGSPQKKGWC